MNIKENKRLSKEEKAVLIASVAAKFRDQLPDIILRQNEQIRQAIRNTEAITRKS